MVNCLTWDSPLNKGLELDCKQMNLFEWIWNFTIEMTNLLASPPFCLGVTWCNLKCVETLKSLKNFRELLSEAVVSIDDILKESEIQSFHGGNLHFGSCTALRMGRGSSTGQEVIAQIMAWIKLIFKINSGLFKL